MKDPHVILMGGVGPIEVFLKPDLEELEQTKGKNHRLLVEIGMTLSISASGMGAILSGIRPELDALVKPTQQATSKNCDMIFQRAGRLVGFSVDAMVEVVKDMDLLMTKLDAKLVEIHKTGIMHEIPIDLSRFGENEPSDDGFPSPFNSKTVH